MFFGFPFDAWTTAGHEAAEQCIKTCRYMSGVSAKFHIKYQMGEIISVTDGWLLVPESILEIDHLPGFSHATDSGVSGAENGGGETIHCVAALLEEVPCC